MSLIKHMRRDKPSSGNIRSKETRWDRIRKKSSNNSSSHLASSLKSDAVRRLLEIDFVGKHQEKLLNGDQTFLNPHVVMDMRHELCRKQSRSLPLVTAKNHHKQDKCIAHNLDVEEHYISNKLNTFRTQLEKRQKANRIKTRRIHEILESDSPRLQNREFMRSLEETSRAMKDFYMAPIEALEANDVLCRKQDNDNDDGIVCHHTKDNESEVFASEELIEAQEANNAICSQLHFDSDDDRVHNSSDDENKSAAVQQTGIECDEKTTEEDTIDRCVKEAERLDSAVPTIEVFTYQREPSNCSICSDGHNSVISNLAEEILLNLQIDDEEEIGTEESEDEVSKEYQINGNESPNSNRDLKEEKSKQLNTDSFLTIAPLNTVSLTLKSESKEVSRKDSLLQSSIAEPEPSPVSNQEQNLIVEQLFQARPHKNIAIMRKYFRKWIHYSTMARIEKQDFITKHDRISKINDFLEKLRREKVRLNKNQKNLECPDQKQESCTPTMKNIQLTKKYQTKIKLQEDIIDLQRLKLERQQRMILELKLNKISKDAKEARQEIKNELKNIIRSGSPRIKAKARCLQAIGDLKDTDDAKLELLQGHALAIPKFLQNMQERALERSIKHEQARQRRLQHEAEREAEKMAAEEAKRLEDENAKRVRIEALKEKRRQEKLQKVNRERERQRAIENGRKSEEYCRRHLLHRIGMEGFRRLVALKRERLRKCEMLLKRLIQKNCFRAWRNYYILVNEEKAKRADNFYHEHFKHKVLGTWKHYVKDERSKFYVAVDWYELKLMGATFVRWFGYSKHLKMIEDTKLYQAALHHQWHLKWKVLDCWQRLPHILKLEKETEERRQRWRMKIWELLPDYTPNRDECL